MESESGFSFAIASQPFQQQDLQLEKLFLCSLYEVGSLVTCPGPEPDPPIWKIYDGVCKQDRKVFVITIVVIVRYGQKVEYKSRIY